MTESIVTNEGLPVFTDDVLANYRLTQDGEVDFIMMCQRARTGKDSVVSAMLGSEVIADQPCTVLASAGSKVFAGNGAVVMADLNCTVTAYAGAEVHAKYGSRITAKAGSKIFVYPGAAIDAEAGATLMIPAGLSQDYGQGVQIIELPNANHEGTKTLN